MNVLIVGGGGREHAIAWKLRQSPLLRNLYCAPGNAGTLRLAENIALAPEDLDSLVRFSQTQSIDLTVVGPEVPLVAGLVDRFRSSGLRIVGPSAAAARLEGSKVFAKDFMAKYGIPTAAYAVFSQPEEVLKTLDSNRFRFPVVIKADGLAAGKGVFICSTPEQSLEAIRQVMIDRIFGSSGARIVLEEFLMGEEVSFMVFCDGKSIIPLAPSRDHKAAFDDDQGPNTGGMGAYSNEAILSTKLRREILDRIVFPVVEGLRQEGCPFQGILYAGLMLTSDGPRVLEFNVRFGDPETQAVLPRLNSDLLEIFDALERGRLGEIGVEWIDNSSLCVVLASGGYPGVYRTGYPISGLEQAEALEGVEVFHAGTRSENGQVVTTGGRVLNVAAWSPDLELAIQLAYRGVDLISFENSYCRRDIARRALGHTR